MLNGYALPIDNVRSFVHDSAPGASREAVVFVHGNPGPSDDWESLVRPVSRFARAVAMDLPGFGRADRPRRFQYDVLGYARHLGGVLDALDVQRAHLVLHDFGGPFGLVWATQHLSRVASVTLINTGVMPGYRWHKYARIWQTPIVGELFQLSASPKMMQRAIDRDMPRPLPASFYATVGAYADWGHKRAVLALYRSALNPTALFAEHTRGLGAVDLPCCVVWGAGDPYIPVEFAEKQKQTFPRAEVHTLPGLGHWPFHDDPDAVASIVVPFLARQLSQPLGTSSTVPSAS
jgi:pimeloyl-ACP methyl ester carboxylesterase